MLWIEQSEWESLLLLVVMPCFLGSWQLVPGACQPRNNNGLAGVTPANCWLQWPCTVRPSKHTKKERELNTGCVMPASKSRIAANLAEAATLAAGGSISRRRHFADRNVRVSANEGGYTYVTFDIWGVLAMTASPRGNWRKRSANWDLAVSACPAPGQLPPSCPLVRAPEQAPFRARRRRKCFESILGCTC